MFWAVFWAVFWAMYIAAVYCGKSRRGVIPKGWGPEGVGVPLEISFFHLYAL